MHDFEKKINRLCKEVSVLGQNPSGFAFWKKLALAEKTMQKMPSKNIGIIEENVTVTGNVFACKNSLIKSGTRIEGNAFIGPGTIVGPNAFLRGFVVTGKKCFIGMSEIKNSILLDFARAPHFNYAGDSVLCEKVNLGAGTKIANLRHDNKNIFVKINGKKIDSKQRKLGAFVCANTKTGINSSINCGCIVQKGTKILPNEFYKK